MSVDQFDIEFCEHEGNPQDTLKELLDWNLAPNNAKKAKSYIKRYIDVKRSLDPDSRVIGEMEELVIKADGSQVSKRMLLLSEEESQDPIRIMKLMGYDPLQWKLDWCKRRRNYWDVTIKNKDWEGEKHTNNAFMCEIKVTPIQGMITTDFVKQVFKEIGSPPLHVYRTAQGANRMLEIPLMDLHLGNRADNWSLDDAENVYKQVIKDILDRVKEYNLKIEKVIFPIGQDFYHVDNGKSQTTKGTVLHTNDDWQAIYRSGIKLMIWAIENLRALAPVEVMYVCSNHDEMLSYTSAVGVHYYFKSDDNVSVDISDDKRKYVRYGKCLIGFSHGEEEGRRIKTVMQVERQEDWGATIFREMHMGHLHSESSEEEGGIIFRRISPLTPTNRWHERKAYIGNIRKAQALVWDKNEGKKLTIDVNILD